MPEQAALEAASLAPAESRDHILVADDDPGVRELLCVLLAESGLTVHAAADGEEAWRMFREEPVRVVLTDWTMPKLTGVELMQRIRKTQDGESVYVILLTGHSGSQELVQAMQAGADDFLGKPCDAEELKVRVQAGLRLVHLQDKLLEQNRRFEADLAAASDLQRSLLPRDVPQPAGYRFAWHFNPCTHVSGDMLNVVSLDEHRVGFFVLDVSGHGAAAAMLAVSAGRMLVPVPGQETLVKRRRFEPPYYHVPEPVEVLRDMRAWFTETQHTGLFFTMLYGILDIRTGRVQWTTAGHEPPVLTSDSEVRVLEPDQGGAIIGPDLPTKDPECSNEFVLEPGRRLWLYSDGIVEARSPHGEEFEMSHFQDTVRELQEVPLDGAVEQAIERARRWTVFGFQDDVSVLALEHRAG